MVLPVTTTVPDEKVTVEGLNVPATSIVPEAKVMLLVVLALDIVRLL